ncbi:MULTISPECIES: acetyl-CoA carboxylase carboxyltransferase subunit alpha [Candidatus Ichthyocystis]|uniref:acetyl-CoA carboxylase carboxyltransferase subunit alpha n=2 Tax=Burkholderiales genera incertae sedis TaxID=224471 RepID=UPI000A876D5D|nr:MULTISPECIES: acetyl-CoA carboxylase carboxyltransferase subunit alpha [Ichthyocystis]
MSSTSKWVALDFERPLLELEEKIDELRYMQGESAVDISEEIARLEKKASVLAKQIYCKLTPWQITQVARHPNRPYTINYISSIFDKFEELHGDRQFADDLSIVGGLASLSGRPVVVIGHQKGRDTKEKLLRNFGMPRPEGYRKALRIMKLAERFAMPIITFVDTPGAYPGIEAEERGQSEAIGKNIYEMSNLNVPILTTVIGEGGSGGALAISVADVIMMFQYSIYSVISPEGCAAILWKDQKKADVAANSLGIVAERLKSLRLIDRVIPEPLGGAHRDHEQASKNLKKALVDELRECRKHSLADIKRRRMKRLMNYGNFKIKS